MDTTAIRQAIRLYKHPREMAWLTPVNAALPSGMTDLLRLCASEKLLDHFSRQHKVNSESLLKVLINFIEKVLLKEGTSAYKTLGTDKTSNAGTIRLHYQLLMKVYHPDKNDSTTAAYFSSKITHAYNRIKPRSSESLLNSTNRGYQQPPVSFYHATQRAEKGLNQTKNTFLAITSIILVVLVIALVYLYQPAPSMLLVKKPGNTPVPELISSKAYNPRINLSSYGGQSNVTVPKKRLQSLLHNLETAYENGNVDLIKPILENAPEIKNQSDQEISAKLKTLFRITEERKMVLYDFNWKQLPGKIEGKGKFLSRYLITGDDEWLTRTGSARIIAERKDNALQIKRLDLKDHSIP